MKKVCGIVLGVFIFQVALAADEPVAAPARPANVRINVPAGVGQTTLRVAIQGAARLLGNPDCQQVLSDFSDANGNRLAANLHASGKSAADYLRQLSFVDASGEQECTRRQVVAAFTSAHSRVIYVCGSRFENPYFGLNGPYGEMVIIHEMLHSLGLEENPPTSHQITRQVVARCAR